MGTYSADDFESGTRAGLAGGTTMVVDFCLPAPDQSLLEALQMWDNKTSRANADYSFHMAITGWNERIFDEMKTIVEDKGINTFKHFMAYKGALMVNDDEMFASFQRCAELGALPLVHAENGDVVASMTAKLLAEGNNGPEGHAYSRPPEVEGEATNRAIMLADMAGVPLYVVHTSCEQAHEAIRRARQKGMRVYGEPLIQHLTLDESEYFNKDWDHAARRVMSPPFRNKQHQDSLWAGLQSGSLSCVATDHCAFTTEQKRFGVGNFAKIPNGTGGLEDRMPMLWTYGVMTGRLTMNEFVAVTSTNIAKIPEHVSQEGCGSGRRRCRPRGLGIQSGPRPFPPRANSRRSTTTSSRASRSPACPRFTLTRGEVVDRGIDGQDEGRSTASSCVANPSPPSTRRCRPGRSWSRRARLSAPAFRQRGCDRFDVGRACGYPPLPCRCSVLQSIHWIDCPATPAAPHPPQGGRSGAAGRSFRTEFMRNGL